MLPWKLFLSRVLVGALAVGAAVGAGVFVGVRLASATPGGRTRDALTYAGVLRGASVGMHPLTFTFQKPGAPPCGPITVMAPVAEGGAFSVPVPLASEVCRAYFDGDDVTYSVAEGTDMLASDVQINPVPYARFADLAGVTSACPAGYGATSTGDVTVCSRTIAGGSDEVVKVGTGSSAFWVDRYEATVVESMSGTVSTSYTNLNANGQWTTAAGDRSSLLAVSRRGTTPSVRVTWFQANALCRAAGKALLRRDEWFAAADGLTAREIGSNNCNVSSTPAGPRMTGMGTSCRSSWGAEDMIGNVWEWTEEWYASVGQTTTIDTMPSPPPATSATAATRVAVRGVRVNDGQLVWGDGFGNDATWNITSVVSNITDDQVGIPSAAFRGGSWNVGTRAGVFTMDLSNGPSGQSPGVGFRCVVRR